MTDIQNTKYEQNTAQRAIVYNIREYCSVPQFIYRSLFLAHVEENLIEDIRSSVNKGLASVDDRLKGEFTCRIW